MENQPQTVALLQSKNPENITRTWVQRYSTEPKGNEKQKREASSQFSHKASDIPLPPPLDGSKTADWFHRTLLLHTWSLTRSKEPNPEIWWRPHLLNHCDHREFSTSQHQRLHLEDSGKSPALEFNWWTKMQLSLSPFVTCHTEFRRAHRHKILIYINNSHRFKHKVAAARSVRKRPFYRNIVCTSLTGLRWQWSPTPLWPHYY